MGIETLIKNLPWSPEKRVPTKAGIRVVCDTPVTPELQKVISDRTVMRRLGLSLSTFKGELKIARWRGLTVEEVQEINGLIAESCAMDSEIQVPVAAGKDYMAFQRAGIAFALKRPNCLIADEPGLGKTVQAIGVVNALSEIKRVLVVAPASLKINWLREISQWLARTMSAGLGNGKVWPNTDIVIINYENVGKHRDKIMAIDWDLLVVDEAHVLKNPETKRAKAVLGYRPPPSKAKKTLEAIVGGAVTKELLAEKYETLCTPPIKAKRKIFLTGTPISNRPKELFAIINALAPDIFGDFMKYARRYCNAQKFQIRGKQVWDFDGATNLDELQQKLRTSIMVRRRKADVLKELPPKIRRIVELPAEGLGLASVLKDGSKVLEKAWKKRDELEALKSRAEASGNPAAFEQAIKALTYSAEAAFEEMSKMRRLLAEKKLPLVIERLREELEDNPEHKMVVFAHHRSVLEALHKEFADNSVMVVGGMTETKKDAAVQAFQNDPKIQLFFGQIEAAGVGLTLTASSHVIMVEDHWVPGLVSQAEDRCHRHGQRDNVFVEHLVIEGSIDVKIIQECIAKQEIIDRALDEPRYLPLPTTVASQPLSSTSPAPDALPTEKVAAIHEGLRCVAAGCDGALALDGKGFSGVDTYIGRSLAGTPSLSPKQAQLGLRLCAKYRRQLPEALQARIFGASEQKQTIAA